MFPRNIREIPPWKMMQILTLMMDLSKGWSWAGNRASQMAFTKALESMNLKTSGHQRDANSGGARTYWAQLEGLGLVFTREADKTVWTTIAGQTLLENRQPLLVLQTQLLRYQYPSPYSAGQNVRIHPSIRIHPFLFLLELIMEPELGGLSNQEFAIPVVYGHNSECLSLCREKILSWRNRGGSGLDQIDSWETDLATPRTEGKRTAEAAWKDLKDVGNTFKNALESNNLIAIDQETGRYQICPEAMPIVHRESQNRDKFLPLAGNQSYQQAYGRFDRLKDNRRLVVGQDDSALEAGASIILSRFFAHCGTSLPSTTQDDWIEEIRKDYGFSRQQIEQTITPYLDRTLSIFETTYLDLSRGGKMAGLDFEKATAQLFSQSLAFDVRHTGQVNRPGVGGYSDLLLLPLVEGQCAIVDTKASGRYGLDSSDYHKMAGNYAKNFRELAPDRSLEFCAYVAGGFTPQIETRLATLKNETGIPASAITASELLELAKRNPGIQGQPVIRQAFRQGGLVDASSLIV